MNEAVKHERGKGQEVKPSQGVRQACIVARQAMERSSGYFLRDVAYFYRFYIFYAMDHPLLCLAEASRLGHPFAKLVVCIGMISRFYHFPW